MNHDLLDAATSPRGRFAGVLVLAGAALFLACEPVPPSTSARGDDVTEGDEHGDEHGEHDEEDGEIGVFPKAVYTGYDGEHDFVVPVASIGGKATWKAADDSIVQLTPSADGVKIKAKKAGKTSVTAKIGSRSFTVKVTVTAYAEDAWAKGEAAYTKTAKCNSCHVKGDGPDHTPTEIGRHEDEHLEARINTGESLHGEDPTPEHDFASKLKEGELEGLLAYLRSMPPAGWPEEGHEHE